MNVPAVLVLAMSPSPSPTSEVTGSQAGSPGILGFIVTFAVALAAIGLFFGLTRQLRRMEHRAEQMGLEGRRRVDGPWPGAAAPDDTATGGTTPEGTPPGGAAPGGPDEGSDDPEPPRP